MKRQYGGFAKSVGILIYFFFGHKQRTVPGLSGIFCGSAL